MDGCWNSPSKKRQDSLAWNGCYWKSGALLGCNGHALKIYPRLLKLLGYILALHFKLRGGYKTSYDMKWLSVSFRLWGNKLLLATSSDDLDIYVAALYRSETCNQNGKQINLSRTFSVPDPVSELQLI
jgi:hypothetical protein